MTTDPTGPLTVAVDDILTTMTPDECDQLADWVESHAPAAVRAQFDQLEAAAGEALDVLAVEAAILGGTGVFHSTVRDVPDWIRLGVLSAYVGWAAGKASTCMHSPHATRPHPVYAAAWKPGLVVCVRCPHLLELPRGSAKDRTCDGYGRVTTGPEHGDGIRPSRVQYGPLILAYGVCSDCTPADCPAA